MLTSRGAKYGQAGLGVRTYNLHETVLCPRLRLPASPSACLAGRPLWAGLVPFGQEKAGIQRHLHYIVASFPAEKLFFLF